MGKSKAYVDAGLPLFARRPNGLIRLGNSADGRRALHLDNDLFVEAAADELIGWSESRPLPLHAALAWRRHAPRAKGAVPRLVGRYFGKNWQVLVKTPDDVRFAVEPGALDVYLEIAESGGWDHDVRTACCSLLKNGDTFFDIGANVGAIALATAAAFDQGVQVFAFEPQPDLARAIAVSARISNLPRVRVIGAMLGDADGTGSLFVGSHSIHASAVAREKGSRTVECPIVRLDDLVARGTLPAPDVIKIDVEGSEMAVFEGGRRTLSNHRPHIVFEADENLARFGHEPTDLFQMLSSVADYRFCVLSGPSGELIPFDPAGPIRKGMRNFVALSPSRAAPSVRTR